MTARAVASYLAKCVTKGNMPGVTIDSRIRHPSEIGGMVVTEHVRVLVCACWGPGAAPEFKAPGLGHWAHQLGHRGHVATISRAYSAAFTVLRGQRATCRRRREAEAEAPPGAVTVAVWAFAGSGHTEGQAPFAESVTESIAVNRQMARKALEQAAWDGEAA